MEREKLLKNAGGLLARFATEVKIANSMGAYDINTFAEDFLLPIFRIVFQCPDLANQNRIQMNFPAIDLGCKTSRISIQITSDSSSAKVAETLEKFQDHSLVNDFKCLYVYVITERQQTYTSQRLRTAIDRLSVVFDPASNILDYKNLAAKFTELNNEQLESINVYLEAEFKKQDASLQFRKDLDNFLSVSQQKIEDEKHSKKYLPCVFVETTEAKEEMRYFANPMFFFRRIDDDIRRVDLDHFNKLLGMAKIEPIANKLQEIANLQAPANLSNLQVRLNQQYSILQSIKVHVSPFSWSSPKDKRFQPSDNLHRYWRIFGFSIESSGSGLLNLLEDISKKIEIAQAKIFLVTGMAGQGKTNFICDLVENQFRAFEIPIIFIPARLLNNYPGPNRILSYITNNRFIPQVAILHDLLSLLNSTAEECKKPFVIALDGINEVGDLGGFVAELHVFLEALCQYDFIKVIITCRNEFFDHKFAEVFEPQFSGYLYRVKNLRAMMSDANKSRLLVAYLHHFQIQVTLSEGATDFLKNDLILLRMFAEINEGKDVGYVSDIYKGDIFEKYLEGIIKKFDRNQQRFIMELLYKICSRMLDNECFSQISVEGFDSNESQILEQLIAGDIILRREIPSADLASLGLDNISFTYDELRDFLLAHYTVKKLAISDLAQAKVMFEKFAEWPIYEGFFRYAYVLARKDRNKAILDCCESSSEFEEHYVNNLSLLPADIQTDEDISRVKSVLKGGTKEDHIRKIAWFLFRRRAESECLNVQILLDHVNSLNDESSEHFFRIMFQANNLKEAVSELLDNFITLSKDQKCALGVPTLAFILHFMPYAHWDKRESTFKFFTKLRYVQEIGAAIDACKPATSSKVQAYLEKILREWQNYAR